MKKLLMLLIVLALSLPAYAFIPPNVLVYKTTMTGPRFGIDGVKKAKVRGYLVLECDTTAMSNLENGQAVPTWGRQMLYVKDGHQKWQSTGQMSVWAGYFQPGKKKGTMFLTTATNYYLGTHEGEMSSAAYGRVRRVSIGTGKPKPRIPTKLKGHTQVDGAWDGSCRLTIKLASKRTKNANKENKNYAQVVVELRDHLDRKGYAYID